MPVTAKLSRRFYEKFGDELTNELVEWLNQVDATYRNDLREFNEANFGRFEVKLDAFGSRLQAQLESLAARLDTKVESLEARLDTSLESLEARLDVKLARLEGGVLARIGMVEGRLARLTLVFWIATLGTLIALLKL
jgi:hypothetical protein